MLANVSGGIEREVGLYISRGPQGSSARSLQNILSITSPFLPRVDGTFSSQRTLRTFTYIKAPALNPIPH
jgi:hypothetical protein